MTIRQAAERIGVSCSTVWQLVRRGEIRASRIVGRGERGTYRIAPAAVDDYLRRITFRPFQPPAPEVGNWPQMIDRCRPFRR